MKYELISDGAAAAIETKGAELQSIKDIFGTEYIWQGDAKYWGRRSPILFPIIGEQKDGKFTYGGKSYAMGRHGFLRDAEFDVLAHDKSRMVLSFASNESTLRSYPFKFRFDVSFSLENTVLTVEYSIGNTGGGDMYFTVGGHTAYNCPFLEDEKFEDYFVEFEHEETFDRLLLNEKGLFNGKKQPFMNGSRSFQLNHSLFDLDAIVPDNLKSKSVSLINRKSGKGVCVNYSDFDSLAIWSAKGNTPFVCLEPWNGRASNSNDGLALEEKHGIIKLAAYGHYSARHTISLL